MIRLTMETDPRAELLACIADPEADVATGALWLAAEDCDDVDVDASLALLADVADELRTRIDGKGGVTVVPLLAAVLRDRLGLRGAGGGDPRAHYLHSVLARGAGVPLTCSVIWMAVGNRAGAHVEGVGLPGHFVVRVENALVDPFAGGELLDDAGVRRIVGKVLGTDTDEVRLDPHWLAATSTREIVARMSRNLRRCYVSQQNWMLALRAADRCVELLPDRAVELRDRGLLRWRAGLNGSAADDLRAYLEDDPNASDRESIEEVLGRLRAASN